MEPTDEPVLTETQMAELSALADGTLADGRRPAVEALLAGSAELREHFERERRIVERLHAARASDRAPGTLRARIAAGGARQEPIRSRRRLRPWALAGLTGALAAALAVVAIVTGGGSPTPSPSSVAALAVRGPADPAPARQPGDPGSLTTHVGSVRFPASIGSLAVAGVRSDRLDGREVVTVYYGTGATRVAYSVIARPALAQEVNWTAPGNVGYYVGTLGGRSALVWRNDGHTCVISSGGLSPQALRELV